VAGEFGRTVTKIGILIAMASIIGKCLLDSGAAERIVRSVLRLTGEKGAPLAFLSSAFVLGIPVFFDTVFYLILPLGKAMGIRTGRNYGLYIMAIVAGTTMAHSLVPPTPGQGHQTVLSIRAERLLKGRPRQRRICACLCPEASVAMSRPF